jgi:hypothetical protein
MSVLREVTAKLGGEREVSVEKVVNSVYNVLLPKSLLSEHEKNDLSISMNFDKQYIVDFKHMGEWISLVGRDVIFSGFYNDRTGVTERLNVSTLEHLQLEGDLRAKAERQDPSIVAYVYEVQEPSFTRTETDGYLVSKAYAPVTYTTGQGSRVKYGNVYTIRGKFVTSYTFILKIVQSDITVF